MFEYTKNDKYLTKEQRVFYEDNGYLIIRKLVDVDLLDECSSRFLEVCNNIQPAPDMIVAIEMSLKHKNVKGEYLVNKIQNLKDDNIFYKYISYKPLVDIVESIIGPNITCCHSVIINKPPDAEPDSSEHVPHQDAYYFPFNPINSLTACWTAIEDSTKENGCLFAYPGTHKNGLLLHENAKKTKNFGYYGILSYDKIDPVHLVVEKGDTIILHPLLLHGSGPNFTKGFRKAILSAYVESNSRLGDFKWTHQKNVGQQLLELYKKNQPHLKNYADGWKSNSKLIRGLPGRYQQYLSKI